MASNNDQFTLRDRARHRQRSAGFWTVTAILTILLLVAFPPTVAVGALPGLAFAGAAALAAVGYIVRLHRAGENVGETELFVAGIASALIVGVDQWLCGGLKAPLYIMLTLHVIAAAAVFSERKLRVAELIVVCVVSAAPLTYGPLTVTTALTVAVVIAVLTIEAGMLVDFGDRLRAQRLALAQAEREASRQALTDPLTGLANRRSLMERLDAAAAGLDDQHPLTIAYLDLDGFKAYNDRFGHAAGDDLLARLGAALNASVAGRGEAFRLGGDEFCVLIHGAVDAQPALVDDLVAALTDEAGGYAVHPSCGVVELPRDASDPDSALHLADERMYACKRARHAPASVDVAARGH